MSRHHANICIEREGEGDEEGVGEGERGVVRGRGHVVRRVEDITVDGANASAGTGAAGSSLCLWVEDLSKLGTFIQRGSRECKDRGEEKGRGGRQSSVQEEGGELKEGTSVSKEKGGRARLRDGDVVVFGTATSRIRCGAGRDRYFRG